MKKNSNKSGITLLVLVITIIVSIILFASVVVSIGNSIRNSVMANFANELKQIEDATSSYYISKGSFPSQEGTTLLSQADILNIVSDKNKANFTEELKLNKDYNDNSSMGEFYKIDLTKIEVKKAQKGEGKNGIADVYVVSYPSMHVYYLDGVDAQGETFFSLSNKLVKLTGIGEIDNSTDNSVTSVQTVAGVSVSKNNATWTNNMNIKIDATLKSNENIYIKIAGSTAEKKINTIIGTNNIKFSSLENLNAQNILTPNITNNEILEFNKKSGSEKNIEIIKKIDSHEVGKIVLDLSNYDSGKPFVTNSKVTSYNDMNVVSLTVSDDNGKVQSGIKEIRYDYLKKYDTNGNEVNYYNGINDFDSVYMETKSKKAKVDNQNVIELKIPKEVKKIKIAVVDNAGNILIDEVSSDVGIYINYKIDLLTANDAFCTLYINSHSGVSKVDTYFSTDGVNYDDKVSYAGATQVNISYKNFTFIQDKVYIKVVVTNTGIGDALKTETKIITLYKSDILNLPVYVNDVLIPDGFYYVGGTKSTGIVISDVGGDNLENSKGGNQFVWIPVSAEVPFARVDWGKGYAIAQTPEDETTAEYVAMKSSVQRNKGFYIARYEAGIPGTTASTETNHNTAINGTVKPVSKKGAGVWNLAKWGTTNNKVNPGDGAVTVARSMYENHPSVVSTLCYDVQWDTALKFIQKTYPTYPTDSTDRGNYNSIISVLGDKDTYKVCNIYDMAGNVYEWTMAANISGYCVTRGGSYKSIGSTYPAGFRSDYNYIENSSRIGFRAALYIK